MPITPAWEAARNGMPGDLDAVNHAAQVNQFLGTHQITSIYAGNRIYDTWTQTDSGAFEGFFWINPTNVISSPAGASLLGFDFDQSFVMPGGSTAIGRIQTAVLPVGNGADLQVSLCADNAGSPGAVLASTVVPREWITQLGASAGYAASGPLATPANNTYVQSFAALRPWNAASTSTAGILSSATGAVYGQFLIFGGGNDSNTGAPVATVVTSQMTANGPTQGVLQPSLPAANSTLALAASQSWVVSVGGSNAAGTATIGNVYVAGWNSSTGTISSWSAQTSLPTLRAESAVAIYQDTYVYVLGGYDNTNTDQPTVYWAAMSNGQLTTWNTGPSLPVACHGSIVGIFGNILVVAGGLRQTTTSINNVYWTRINSDGSLGGWNPGPSLPTAIGTQSGSTYLSTEAGFNISGGQTTTASNTFAGAVQNVSVNGNGQGTWVSQSFGGGTNNLLTAGYANGDGTYTAVNFVILNGASTSQTYTLYTTPYLSIPLPATGLTSGSTYHIQFHQLGGDQNDYVQLGEHYSSSQSWLYSTRYSGGPWSAHTAHAIPLTIFDRSTGGNVIHTWEDPSPSPGLLASRTSEYVYDARGRLLGYCESTALPNEAMNPNPTFSSGIPPWTSTNCTLTQSSAQTQGGNPFSGLITPNGTSGTVYITTPFIAVNQGVWYSSNSWMYSPTGYSNIQIDVDWYDSGQNYLTSSAILLPALAANTWGNFQMYAQAPAQAAYGKLSFIEAGTPTTSNLLYLSNAQMNLVDPPYMSTVEQVVYDPSNWPPISTVQLA